MRVALLGPLEVESDGRSVDIGARTQRVVLALLALRLGRAVGARELTDVLWPDGPPPSALKALQTYVARLRQRLPGGSIHTVPGGYCLRARREDVDATHFEDLVNLGNSAVDPSQSTRYFEEALGLWRGPALTDLDRSGTGLAESARLDELRCATEEALADARLALGRHQSLVADLEAAVQYEPLRERRWAQLMLALYRCGRQADALRAYQRLRTVLDEQLGIAPSPQLVALERAVLCQAPELAWPDALGA